MFVVIFAVVVFLKYLSTFCQRIFATTFNPGHKKSERDPWRGTRTFFAFLGAGCEDRTVENLFVLGGHCCDTPALAEKSCLLVLSPDLILYQMTIRGSKNSNPWGKRRGRSDEVVGGGGKKGAIFFLSVPFPSHTPPHPPPPPPPKKGAIFFLSVPFPSLPHPIPAPFSRLLSN